MPPTQPSSPSDKGTGEPAALDAEDRFLLAVAANRPDLLPNRLSDIDRLTDRIREHRLEGRCRRHARHFAARGYQKQLFDAVNTLCGATQEDYARNREALEAMAVRMAPDFGVVIKGFSAYLLTGDPATLRCGDIDVIVADSAPVIEYLFKCGFRQTRQPFLHEIGEFSRDGIEFDLQWGFPICRYPDRLNDGSEGQARASGLMANEYIDAGFIRVNSETVALGAGRIRVPTVELAVLIAASHAFMNYTNIWSISHREKAWLRLAEFADILDLRSSSSFSPARFRELAVRFRAEDVVAWADLIWARLSGQTLFTDISLPPPRPSALPCCLWWNLWIPLEPPMHLLLRAAWFPMGNVLQILERSAVGGACDGHGRGGPEGATALPLLWEAGDWRGVFRFRSVLVGNSLKLILNFERTGHAPRFRIRVDAGVQAEEITADVADCEIRMSNTGFPVRASISRSEITVDLDLSGLHFDRRWNSDGDRCGYVGVAAEESGQITACTVFPFRMRDGET